MSVKHTLPWVLARIAPAALVGVVLRLWNLRPQVLGGDELHAVRAAVSLKPAEILTHYSLVDYPLPLTALASALLEWGVPLDEMAFRIPSLVAGIAALAILPLLWARVLGPAEQDSTAAAFFAWLLALSPALVLYSRIARSYLPMVLASTLAISLFALWWERRDWRLGGGYVLAGAAAVWLHLGAAPIVVSPFAFAALVMVTRAVRARSARALFPDLKACVALGLAMLGAWALFLIPAMPSLVRLIEAKHRENDLTVRAIWAVMRIQAGSGASWVAGAFWLAALVGWVLLAQRRPLLAGFTVAAVLGQVLGLLLLAPSALGQPIALNRYVLPILPFVLLWVAVALAAAWNARGALRGWRFATRGGLVLALLGWVVVGPLAGAGFRRGTFAHHNAFVAFVVAPPRTRERDHVDLYRRLPPGPVLDVPWYSPWDGSRSLAAYQLEHRRRVLVAATDNEVPPHPALRFANAVPIDPAAILASPAAAIVVHTRMGREESQVEGGGWTRARMRARVQRRLRQQSDEAIERLTAAWGPPDDGAGSLQAWNLERIRSDGAGGPGRAGGAKIER